MTPDVLIRKTHAAVIRAAENQEELLAVEKRFAGESFRYFAVQYLMSVNGPDVEVLDRSQTKRIFNIKLFPQNSRTGDYRTNFSILPHVVVADLESGKVKEVYCVSSSGKATWVDEALEKYKADIRNFPNVFDDNCRVFLITPADSNLETNVDGVVKKTVPVTTSEFGEVVKKLWNSEIVKH